MRTTLLVHEQPDTTSPGRLPWLPLGRLMIAYRVSMLELARRSGEHPRQLHRWQGYGVTVFQADRLAMAIGHHPVEVWGSAWETAPMNDR